MTTDSTVPQAASHARFAPGQLVQHLRFDYRGVVVDVDAIFQGTEDWYETMARSRPPRNQPWYHVLVDGAEHQTYVAERNLAADDSGEPVIHPELALYFSAFQRGRYLSQQRCN